MRVRELMTRDVGTCRSTDSAADAARVMWDRDCGIVPIVDDGRVRGVVTDRDLLMATQIEGKNPQELRLSSFPAAPLQTCREDDDVERVLEKMAGHQVRRLPVVDGEDRLVGIVSLNDVAEDAVGRDDRMIAVAKTLAAVGRHREGGRARA